MIAKPKPVRVLYVDIDGTVRKGFSELGRFVNSPADVELFDGMRELLGKYREAGWRIIAVSNQGGIATGQVTMRQVADAMMRTHQLTGGAFDRMTWCSHHPDAKDPEWSVCWCRKPRIGGLVLTASNLAQETGEMYPPHLSLFVGDRPEDEGCAQNAGIPFMWAHEWRALGPSLTVEQLRGESDGAA